MKHLKVNGKWIHICGNCGDEFTTKRKAKDHFATCQFMRALDAMQLREDVLALAQMMPVVAADAAGIQEAEALPAAVVVEVNVEEGAGDDV